MGCSFIFFSSSWTISIRPLWSTSALFMSTTRFLSTVIFEFCRTLILIFFEKSANSKFSFFLSFFLFFFQIELSYFFFLSSRLSVFYLVSKNFWSFFYWKRNIPFKRLLLSIMIIITLKQICWGCTHSLDCGRS